MMNIDGSRQNICVTWWNCVKASKNCERRYELLAWPM